MKSKSDATSYDHYQLMQLVLVCYIKQLKVYFLLASAEIPLVSNQ